MAIDTAAKRWSMLSVASGVGRSIVFSPDTSGLVSIEKITVLKYYGGNAWDGGSAFQPAWAINANCLIQSNMVIN